VNIVLGYIFLGAAALAAGGAFLAAILGGALGSAWALALARRLLIAFAAMVALASAVLVLALVGSDFSIAYVASYTERALPLGYKLAAFWAGQEGSPASLSARHAITPQRSDSSQSNAQGFFETASVPQ
jgi:cytochrome c-type biogenesis protein CcmF